MKIGFVNYTPMIYDVTTPLNEPLGGSESSMCYLAVELVKLGHTITLFGRKNNRFTLLGVTHRPDRDIVNGAGQELDVLVIQNTPEYIAQLKPHLNTNTKTIFWTQHAPDQPVVSCLEDPEYQRLFDAIVYISQWQQTVYQQYFRIGTRPHILRNAIALCFEESPAPSILSNKKRPPILAYTSTPFRGLDILIKIFPKIRDRYPGITLKVFSSMMVYQHIFTRDLFQSLYTQCRQTPGVEYIGSLPQPALAQALSDVAILAYPNTFPETSCISVMEAMASGCKIVTTDSAALPETTAGFGELVAPGQTVDEFSVNFSQSLTVQIDRFISHDQKLESELQDQIRYAKTELTWSKRAEEWVEWLTSL